VFAVVVTGLPGAGKTATLTALSDALVADHVAHAAVDCDEIAWAYPFPDLAQRCEHLRAWATAHRMAGHALLLAAEVIESNAHLHDVLVSLGADAHLLVAVDAPPETLRRRIVEREPSGWWGLGWLLDHAARLRAALEDLDGVHLTLDTEALTVDEVVERIRVAWPDRLGASAGHAP
jgi:adenylylsulfate kinase-like enzyme